MFCGPDPGVRCCHISVRGSGERGVLTGSGGVQCGNVENYGYRKNYFSPLIFVAVSLTGALMLRVDGRGHAESFAFPTHILQDISRISKQRDCDT